MHNRTILGLLLLAIVGMLSIELMIATPVFGHANHERSIPAPNAELDTAPSKVTIWFSETIEPNFSEITVLDNLGVSVDYRPTRNTTVNFRGSRSRQRSGIFDTFNVGYVRTL